MLSVYINTNIDGSKLKAISIMQLFSISPAKKGWNTKESIVSQPVKVFRPLDANSSRGNMIYPPIVDT